MEIRNWQEITLGGEIFDEVRAEFDVYLQKLFQKMNQNKMNEGTITLKVNVNMTDDFVMDEDGNHKRIEKPIFKHKITTDVQVKDSIDGKKDTGMQIIYDEDLKRYVLKYVSRGGQRSIFDPDYGDIVNGTYREVEEEAVAIEQKTLLIEGGDKADNATYSEEKEGNEEITEEKEKNVACDDSEAYDDDDYEYEEGE